MKTVIYQYYDGETTSGNEAGRKAMSQYAKRIGSEYILPVNVNIISPFGYCLTTEIDANLSNIGGVKKLNTYSCFNISIEVDFSMGYR